MTARNRPPWVKGEDQPGVMFVTPHGRAVIRERGWSTRPAQLAVALTSLGTPVTILARTHPRWVVRGLRETHIDWAGAWPYLATRPHALGFPLLLEHGMPAGPLEHRLVRAVSARLGALAGSVLVSDPRSAGVFAHLPGRSRVFDAYDAWDISPLYMGFAKRVRAIRRGYALAARHADLVVANTPRMCSRLADLGAKRVELLPNGAPAAADLPQRTQKHLLYLGNVQRRVSVPLLTAAAGVARRRGMRLRIAGAIQDEPDGWGGLLRRQEVEYVGPVFGHDLQRELQGAAVGLIPHLVNEYTLSQDAMKVWDYLSWGIPVVGTSVPPLTTTPETGLVANDANEFAEAIERSIAEDNTALDAARRRVAAENSWEVRAIRLLALIDSVQS